MTVIPLIVKKFNSFMKLGKANNTIHYLVQMIFTNERKLEFLENNNRIEIKKKVNFSLSNMIYLSKKFF